VTSRSKRYIPTITTAAATAEAAKMNFMRNMVKEIEALTDSAVLVRWPTSLVLTFHQILFYFYYFLLNIVKCDR
jgi:hypothetical protein